MTLFSAFWPLCLWSDGCDWMIEQLDTATGEVKLGPRPTIDRLQSHIVNNKLFEGEIVGHKHKLAKLEEEHALLGNICVRSILSTAPQQECLLRDLLREG